MGLAQRRVIAGFGGRLDGAVRILGGAALIAETAVHVSEPERVRAAQRGIGESRQPRFVREQHVDALAKASEEVQRMRMAQRDVQHPAVALGAFGQPLQAARRQVEVQDRFRVGVHARRALRRADQPGHRFVDQIRARIVIGERRGHLVETIAVQLLERLRRSQVELAAAARQQAVVGDVLRQRVLEDEHRLVGGRRARTGTPGGRDRRATVRDRAPRRQARQQPQRHFAPEDRGRLQQLLRSVRQAIEPRHDDAVNGFGNRACRRRRARSPCARALRERTDCLRRGSESSSTRQRRAHRRMRSSDTSRALSAAVSGDIVMCVT